ncbi:hypothetical protein AYO21_12125 [Fonsecaea monophora]|uniref:Uncharacterized protein n=1 Tax=Fonsecaea monophora TaxID=254056 RepID=A0A177EP73_9EURO|nr:hypothetical protein AYO21_12125 [Fonsecaea monophora]OAG33784.1 hypothetical protein AYO21_12125 [Fonsecaea monophora]
MSLGCGTETIANPASNENGKPCLLRSRAQIDPSPAVVQELTTSSSTPRTKMEPQDWKEIGKRLERDWKEIGKRSERDWKEDDNVLIQLQRESLEEAFFDDLEDHVSDICDIVACHLSLGRRQRCIVAPRSQWLHGSFNTWHLYSCHKLADTAAVVELPVPLYGRRS